MQFWVGMYMLSWRTQLEHQRTMATQMLMHQLLMNSRRYFAVRGRRRRRAPRKVWAKTRSNDWWERIVLSPDTFRFLCTRLKPYLSSAAENTIIGKPIIVEKKVAIALYRI
nr:unnamed protein product [Callosobruchus analis]